MTTGLDNTKSLTYAELGNPNKSLYPEGYEKMVQESESRRRRVDIFTEILRARCDLSPAQAADAAIEVCKKIEA